MPVTSASDRIVWVSKATKHLCTAFMILVPVGTFLFWLKAPGMVGPIEVPVADGSTSAVPVDYFLQYGPDTLGEQVAAMLLSVLPLSIMLFGLFFLRRLFSLYEQGTYFTSSNVDCFRNISWALLLSVPAGILYSTALVLAFTWNNPPGQRSLSVGISSHEITQVLTGLILLVISWVMAEAVRLREENAQFV